jgi:hypothetical protein
MPSSGMLHHVTLVRRATQHNLPEDGILHSHHRENLKSYIDNAVNLHYVQKPLRG